MKPALAQSAIQATNLPLQLTSFIGREREIAEVKRLLRATRLLTLTGSGGCGKTRLALQVAGDLRDDFSDDIWLIELAPLVNSALVAQTIASALGIHESGSLPILEILTDYLRAKNLLLVLDNCEHLIRACAQITDQLLHTCVNLHILVTSREALDIAGETTFRVPSLALPDSQSVAFDHLIQYEAIQLFAARALAAASEFQLTKENVSAVSQICRRLDGMPLAIELAAARIKSLSVEEIAARLDDRFHLLTSGSRTAPLRQQTLAATLDWSYALLSEPERKVLQRFSIFAGGGTLEAAESVCPDAGIETAQVLDVLSHLVDKSLVLVDRRGDGETRYHLLETIRQYAREKLSESSELASVRNRHLDFFLKLAIEAEPKLYGAEQVKWLNRLEREHDNLRAALVWSQTAEVKAELALKLAGALGRFWEMRGYFREGREHLSAALSKTQASAETAARAKALCAAGDLAFEQGDFPMSRSLLEQSVSIYRELGPAGRWGLAEALRQLGYTATEMGDYAPAFSLIDEALRIMRELKDLIGIARALRQLGWHQLRAGELGEAAKFFEEALPLSRQTGSRYEMSIILSGLADVKLRQGDSVRAAALEEESLQLARDIGYTWRVPASLGSLGRIALHRGDLEKAATLLGESLTLRREIGERAGTAWCLEKFAEIALTQVKRESVPKRDEDFRRAARLFGAAAALRTLIGSTVDLVDVPEYERLLAIVRDQLGLNAFETNWAEGQAMTLEQAIEYTLEATVPHDQKVKLGTRRQMTKKEFGGLTPREREAAALVALGMSNREIAEKLVVSERTVESHVANILSKLGFTARTQIAAWAVEKGLARPKKD